MSTKKKTTTRKRRTPAKKEQEVSPLLISGDTGLKRYSGRIVDDPLTELHGRRGMEAYRRMGDNSPIIGAYLWLVETMLRSAEMTIEAAPDSGEAGEAVREFVESCYSDMAVDFEQHVSEASTFALYGWSACEPVYKIRRGDSGMDSAESGDMGIYASNHNDGRFGFADLAPRAQDSLDEWDMTHGGELRGMWQRVETAGLRTYIPAWKLYIFHARENKRSPEGRSALRAAYTSQHSIDLLLPLEGIGAERDLAGMPVMQLPLHYMQANAPAEVSNVRRHYEDKMRAVRRDALEGLVIPAEEDSNGPTGFKFGLLTSGGTGRVQLDAVIRRLESRVLISVLAEFLLVAIEGVGAKSAAEPKMDLAMQALRSYTRAIDRIHSRRIIPDLMRTNGIPRELWPTMEFGRIEAQSLVEIGNFVSAMVNVGAIVPDREMEKYLRKLGDLPLEAVEARELVGEPTPEDLGTEPLVPAPDLASSSTISTL